jgi:hypothetical protein
MNLASLAATTNTILRLERPSPADLRFALDTACKELTSLVQSSEFFELIKRAKDNPNYQPAHLRGIFDDLSEFEKFLENEARLLKEHGLEKRSIDGLLKTARDLRQSIRAHDDYDAIRKGMFEVRDEACVAASELASHPAAASESRSRIRRVLRKAGYVIAGATIVVADASAEVTLGQLYAHASVDFGVAVVLAGVGIKE